tara:strand:- start:3071 stop:3637 length:567 start_codon:yes stop_codon:yes gene_type:complete
MFHADGTGNGGKDWEGIAHIVDGSTLTANTLGGIDPSAAASVNEWWTSSETAVGGALTTAAMATMYNNVSVGNDQPTIILTTQTLYEKYETLLTSNIRYTDTDMADAGFQNLMFKGAPVTFDGSCASGVVYFLNTKYLQLVRHSDVWFKPTPFVRPTNQDAVFSQILCYGQLTCSNRARQGKLTGATA